MNGLVQMRSMLPTIGLLLILAICIGILFRFIAWRCFGKRVGQTVREEKEQKIRVRLR